MLSLIGGLLAGLALLLGPIGGVIYAQSPVAWTPPVAISDPDRFNWFADITVDLYGVPHVVWDSGMNEAERQAHPGEARSLLMHSQLDSQTWTKPIDVGVVVQMGAGGHIFRPALTADQSGNLAILYEGKLIQAPAKLAGSSAKYWSEPYPLSNGAVYMGNITVDQNGVIHALYDNLRALELSLNRTMTFGQRMPTYLADIYYRRSTDGGETWSDSLNLSRTEIGEHREKLEVDPAGTIYAAWDEGWDRLTENGRPERGVVVISRDGGETWSPKKVFDFPERSNAQFVATGNGQGGVLAVWRATNRKDIFYSWSTDWGETWNIPQIIPAIFARDWEETRFDSYDLVVDSAGTIHLAMVGRLEPTDKTLRVYHLSWNGQTWSEPVLVFEGLGWPEWPRIVVSQGNRLHLVWFVRNQMSTNDALYQIWYSSAAAVAPAQPLPPTPTSTPVPMPTPTPVYTPTPTAINVEITSDEVKMLSAVRTVFYTENDDLMLLFQSLAPLFVLVFGFVVVQRYIRRRQ